MPKTRRRAALTISTILGASALTLSPLLAAHADAALAEAYPAEGEVVATAPAEIVLTFNEPLFEDAAHALLVTGGDGADVTEGEWNASGDTLSIPVRITADGVYEVTWQVISIDGHTISDAYYFGVGEATVVPESAHESEADTRNQQILDPAIVVPIAVILAAGLAAFVLVLFLRTRQRPVP